MAAEPWPGREDRVCPWQPSPGSSSTCPEVVSCTAMSGCPRAHWLFTGVSICSGCVIGTPPYPPPASRHPAVVFLDLSQTFPSSWAATAHYSLVCTLAPPSPRNPHKWVPRKCPFPNQAGSQKCPPQKRYYPRSRFPGSRFPESVHPIISPFLSGFPGSVPLGSASTQQAGAWKWTPWKRAPWRRCSALPTPSPSP